MVRKLLWVMVVVMLASCRTVPVHQEAPGPAQSWEARRPQLQARDRFELKGRVAVATGSDGFTARLRWTQSGKQTRMSLDGPLGAGGVQITSDGSAVSIVTSRGDRLENEAAKAELTNRLGFVFLFVCFCFWVFGVF